MRLAAFALSASLAAAAAAGDFSREAVGTSAAQFLKLAVSARGAALGEAYSALADDASALYWNPAGLIKVSSNSVVLMHNSYLADSNFEYASYARKISDTGVWAVSVQYLNSGSITQTDTSGVETGNFSPYDLAVSMGFASYVSGFNKYPEQRVVLGVSAKIVSSKIINRDTTVSADMGLLLPWLFEDRFQAALVVQNFTGKLRFREDSFSLPLTLKLGTRTRLAKYWDVTADAAAPRDNYPYLAMGTEVRLPFSKTFRAALRAGANTRAFEDYDGLRQISCGLGISAGAMAVDYAFNPFGELGNSHRISMTFTF